jgi:hypothetical protein
VIKTHTLCGACVCVRACVCVCVCVHARDFRCSRLCKFISGLLISLFGAGNFGRILPTRRPHEIQYTNRRKSMCDKKYTDDGCQKFN